MTTKKIAKEDTMTPVERYRFVSQAKTQAKPEPLVLSGFTIYITEEGGLNLDAWNHRFVVARREVPTLRKWLATNYGE